MPIVRFMTTLFVFLALHLTFSTPLTAAQVLRWNFVPGSIFKVKTQQATTHKANESQVKSELHIYATWKVVSVEPAGTASLGAASVSQSVDRITFSTSIPGGEFMYDSSSSEPPSGTVRLLASSFVPLLNRTIEMKVSQQGKLLQAKWAKSLEGTTTAKTANAKGPVDDAELELTRLHGSLVELPEAGLSAGDTWQFKHSTSLPTINESMDVENRYTYRGPREVGGQMLDQIDVTGRITIGRGEAGGTAFDIKQQDVRGTILFNADEGRVVESEIDQKMTVNITTGEQTVTHELAILTKSEVTPIQVETIPTSDNQ